MTAYGRGRSTRSNVTISVEITSLNRKHLEIKMSLPRELAHLEADLRSWMTPHIGRGAITLRVVAEWKGKPPHALFLNSPLLKHYVDEGKLFEKEANIELPPAFWVEWALKQEGVMVEKTENEGGDLRLVLEEAVQDALRPFLEMKLREGAVLAADLKKRMDKLETAAEKLGVDLVRVVPRLEEKMREFLAPHFSNAHELEERVLREVALLARNGDYTEELIRLRSHLQQASALFTGDEMQMGKTMEFLLQEMGREVNTIGSKAQDLEVSKRTVEMKSELEKIREQIQNVE